MLEPLVRVGDHQLDAVQAPAEQTLEKARPKRFGFRRAQPQADDLPLAFGAHGHRDYGGDRNDPAALADLEVGRVQPEVRPLAFQGPFQEAR